MKTSAALVLRYKMVWRVCSSQRGGVDTMRFYTGLSGDNYYFCARRNLTALSAASMALDQAHWRLKPPQSPSTSKSSPAAKSPASLFDPRVSGENSAVEIPPAETWEFAKPVVPVTRKRKSLMSSAVFESAAELMAETGAFISAPLFRRMT